MVQAECDLLRSAGHEVYQHQVENPTNPGAALTRLAFSGWNPAAAAKVVELARTIRPDIAHVHNTWFSLSPSVLHGLARQGIPVVLTVHNYRLLCANALLFRDGHPCEDCVGSHPWHGVRHRCYRGSAIQSAVVAGGIAIHQAIGTWERRPDHFFALTEFARQKLVAGGLPATKITVKPNFVPDPGPRPEPPSRSSVVVFVGRLSQEKGLSVVLEAWARARPSDLELLVIGDGPERASLEAAAPVGVRFLGQLQPPEVKSWMQEARALVFPSIWYEAQPMVLLEALANGLPVLGSRLGGTAETIGRLGNDWLVAPGDTDAWAAALARLDHDRVDSASLLARRIYSVAFSPSVGLDLLEKGYRRVIGR